jgi:hypothetical protein
MVTNKSRAAFVDLRQIPKGASVSKDISRFVLWEACEVRSGLTMIPLEGPCVDFGKVLAIRPLDTEIRRLVHQSGARHDRAVLF